MKKLINLSICFCIISVLYSGCAATTVLPTDTPTTSNEINPTTVQASETPIGDTLPTPNFENEYTEAINAYRYYLLNNPDIPVSTETKFTLLDVTRDGIPELHIMSDNYYIFTYKDGEIQQSFGFPQDATLLHNMSVFSDYWDRHEPNADYYYTELDSGDAPTLRFSKYYHGWRNELAYAVNIYYEKRADYLDFSKEEFEELFAPYIEFCTDPKNYDMISWTNYGEWIEQHPDEYVQPDPIPSI